MQHPLLRIRNLYAYGAVWLTVAVLHVLVLRANHGVVWQWAIVDAFVFNATFAALGFSLWFICKYISVERISFLRILENHIFSAAFAVAVWLGGSFLIIRYVVDPEQAYIEFVESTLLWRGLLGLMYYFVIISFYYVFIFSENLNARLVREAELKALVKETELKSLKFQLNPHFVFNSLNSLNSLTLSDPQRASEMTVKLGDYLRHTLSRTDQQSSSLREELDSAKLYIEIEKVRFGDKIDYQEDIGQNCFDVPVPSMIVQPLLENAIKHGVYESLDKVTIAVRARQNGAFLKLTIENNFDPDAVPQNGGGIGLQNVRDRLETMYKRVNLVNVDKSEGLFEVNLIIPVEENSL